MLNKNKKDKLCLPVILKYKTTTLIRKARSRAIKKEAFLTSQTS